jgi:hypothetical protein
VWRRQPGAIGHFWGGRDYKRSWKCLQESTFDAGHHFPYDPDNRISRPLPGDAQQACRVLEDGNREFAEVLDPLKAATAPVSRIVRFDLRDLGAADSAGVAPEQRPFAVVLGCSDARVPIKAARGPPALAGGGIAAPSRFQNLD